MLKESGFYHFIFEFWLSGHSNLLCIIYSHFPMITTQVNTFNRDQAVITIWLTKPKLLLPLQKFADLIKFSNSTLSPTLVNDVLLSTIDNVLPYCKEVFREKLLLNPRQYIITITYPITINYPKQSLSI